MGAGSWRGGIWGLLAGAKSDTHSTASAAPVPAFAVAVGGRDARATVARAAENAPVGFSGDGHKLAACPCRDLAAIVGEVSAEGLRSVFQVFTLPGIGAGVADSALVGGGGVAGGEMGVLSDGVAAVEHLLARAGVADFAAAA